ncbi:hypothetical protein Dimus_011104 [Dionaea muscipula]
MPLFISDDELDRLLRDGDGRAVAEKADAFIRGLYSELEAFKAQADAASINAEQTCSILEDKYISLSSEHADLQSRYSQCESNLQQRLSELAQVQAEKQQLHLQAIAKDGENERLSAELSQLHASRRQLMELVEQKDAEISEKNSTLKSYLDKIVNLTDSAAQREACLGNLEAELARTHSLCERLSQEKVLIEKHNLWLNEELTAKFDSLMELKKRHAEQDASLYAKLGDVEKQFNDCSGSLRWYKEMVKDLELKLTAAQEELSAAKDSSAASEERYSNEIATVSKLVDLYKESSEEWSKKAGDLEGVIKALETHLSQVEGEYKANLEKEVTMRKAIEKEVAELKEKLVKSEAEIEANRKASELSFLPSSRFGDAFDSADVAVDNRMLVPYLPAAVSGTALAASLLRDGWSLAKLYAKYQEAVDALRHEQMGRQQSQAILERVLSEIEEKSSVILDERVEHERMTEAHYLMSQKLQQSLSEQAKLEKVIQELKATMKRREREFHVTEKEVVDLQKQVTILLKECHDLQFRFGSVHYESASDDLTASAVYLNAESDVERVISEQLLTFKDINGLVEQNVKLRSLVRSLSDKIDSTEVELKEQFEIELQKHNDEAASRIAAILERAEEQGRMIESLHSSVSMYKRLYEEQNHQPSHSNSVDVASAVSLDRRKHQMLLLEGSQEAAKKLHEQAGDHLRILEEDLTRCKSEIVTLRAECDKATLHANFSQERLERFMKELDHQREEANGILARNVELSRLIVDYEKKLHERSESLLAAEEHSRRLITEVAVLKQEKNLLLNSEKRACEEVRDLSERVHRLQASLNAIQSTEEVREEARATERRKQEEYLKKIEKEWAEAKKELQDERDNARSLSLDRDRTIKDAMGRVEEMGKELAKVLHDLSAAEARAVVAEERYSDLERKFKLHVAKVGEQDGGYDPSSSANEIAGDLHMAKEEIKRLKAEVQASNNHMLQYKSIAEVNEAALKQMENAYENLKAEADKLQSSLEAEIVSLRDRVSELEQESILRSKEVATIIAEKDEALASAVAEITIAKDMNTAKIMQVESVEVQVRALREDVDREHKRWRVAQDNYERQVILQSETIQELTQTSQALLSLQDEASELRKLADASKRENDELKAKWGVEKSVLEEARNEAEKKYSEINEQNKILHDRLEAMHIKLAEKDRNSTGLSSTNSNAESETNSGLQTVMNYLRRSKEIAETEISLLKQEKLRLQSQLERAVWEAEEARAERANSKTLSFTEDEFKSLQLQVRELSLLRESNCQLREENKHNFDECQKLREVSQKAKLEAEHLSTILKERENEVEVAKMEIEKERLEKGLMEDRITELLVRCKQIDVEDYQQIKGDLQQMQGNMMEKDTQIEKMRKLVSEKEESMMNLQQDLAGLRTELVERESQTSQVEAQFKVEHEKQKKLITQLRRRVDHLTKEKESLLKEKEPLWKEKDSLLKEKESLLKEKDGLSKENHALSKQVEDLRQGKKATGDSTSEQDLRETFKEKDTRIQSLEKALERQREEYKKEKEKRQTIEKAIMTKVANVDQEKKKIEDEHEKHKEMVKKISDDLEKLKHARDGLPEGTSVVQVLSGNLLDDLASAYMQAVEDFERSSHSILLELGAPATSSVVDTAAGAGEQEKKVSMPKITAETRKTGRKLVRPRLVRSEEPQGDSELPEMEGGKPVSTHDVEKQSADAAARKRLASTFTSELHEEPLPHSEIESDGGIHAVKKLRGSELPLDDAQFPSASESVETPPYMEVPVDSAAGLPQDIHEEATDTEKNGIKIPILLEEPRELLQTDNMDQADIMIDDNALAEENLQERSDVDSMMNDGIKAQSQQEQQPTLDIDEREEGELEPEYLDGGETSDMMDGQDAVQTQWDANFITSVFSPAAVEEEASAVDEDFMETVLGDFGGVKNDEAVIDDIGEGSEKPIDVNDQIVGQTDPAREQTSSVSAGSPAAPAIAVEDNVIAAATEATHPKEDTSSAVAGAAEEVTDVCPSPVAVEASHAKEDTSSSVTGAEEVKDASPSPVASSSTTINLNERARQRSALRLGQLTPPVSQGRGRPAARGRGARGARGGRRQSSGDQA